MGIFDYDPTGTLQGYFERMHPSVQVIIEHVMEQATAQIDPADMSMVWRGWVKQGVMQAIFGDVYDHEARPDDKHIWASLPAFNTDGLSPGSYRYGTWATDYIIEAREGDSLDKETVITLLKGPFFVLGTCEFGKVSESMILVTEGEGVFKVRLKVRGWRKQEEVN